MDIRLEEFELALEGPLDAAGLPAAVLYGVAFTFLHKGRNAMAADLGRILAQLAGAVQARSGWLRDNLLARGRMAIDAEVGSRRGRVVARQRLKATRVAELANALKGAGATHLLLHARVQRFGAPGGDESPMLDG